VYHQYLGVIKIKIEVTFRLLNLDKFQAITLLREVDRVTYEHHPKKNCFVGSVGLNQSLDNLDDLNIFYVRQRIPLQDCDILIAVTPADNEKTVATPMFVNKVLKHIDCQLTFSFNLSKKRTHYDFK
jgi:hypothetical protein